MKRKKIKKTEGKEIISVTRIGGYWYVDKKFPFLHFEKEKLVVATKSGVYVYGEEK